MLARVSVSKIHNESLNKNCYDFCLITEGDEVEIHDWVLISHLHISASLAPLATSQGSLPWLDW